MTHTREELESMTREDLALILRGFNLAARGKDATLINRILQHQEKSQLPENDPSEPLDASDNAHADAFEEAVDADILDGIQAQLRLKDETIVILRKEHFITAQDLRDMNAADFKLLCLPLRNQKALLKNAGRLKETHRCGGPINPSTP